MGMSGTNGNSKGDDRRPMSITRDQFNKNWELAFGKKQEIRKKVLTKKKKLV